MTPKSPTNSQERAVATAAAHLGRAMEALDAVKLPDSSDGWALSIRAANRALLQASNHLADGIEQLRAAEERTGSITAAQAIDAVRRRGRTEALLAFSLDEERHLGYTGWWAVSFDYGTGLVQVGDTGFAVSPNLAVHEFGSIPPWVQGLRADEL
ncbi:hypothetical protein ACDF64_13165 [Agromyces sp. MMS24-JH15]|uniref:hypothetical protein n=1 Tax=Agromyces sp. MMS24-JH15 TaxID=3243765 RepID=UPI0037495B08